MSFHPCHFPLIEVSQKYITWVSDNKVSWTLNAPGVGPDPSVEISARQVSQEPMVGFTRLLVTS